MLRFQQGNSRAFDELVLRNTPKVHGLIYRFLGTSDYVEDLTQEVFLRIYRTADRYRPTAKFSTWLYRIAANLSFNVLRSRRKDRTTQLEVSTFDEDGSFYRDVPDESIPAPGERLDAAELRRKVVDAVNSLPENQKIAIILSKYEQKSYEDIAAVLDCTTMAVKSLLSRARENLREVLIRYLRVD
jgi:RNA polymerase sigma-70 factor (ECF subfamily)